MSIFITDKKGQLGNRLFLYAHFIGFAKEYDFELYNFAFIDYQSYFENSNHQVLPSFNTTKKWSRSAAFTFLFISKIIIAWYKVTKLNLPGFKVHYIDSWDKTVELDASNFDSKKYHLISGWGFRNHSLLAKHQTTIANHLSPKKNYFTKITNLNLDKSKFIYCGVHIRKGDYEKFEGGKYYFTLENYKTWMDQFAAKHPHKSVVFIIASNEKITPKDFPDHKIIFSNGEPIEDIICLTSCNYIIGPPSTFSGWASYYGTTPLLHMQAKDAVIDMEHFKVYQ
ncbi:MAG: hypothetical protein RIQ89_1293 [Bacteroidota bacterium]|jgi:hypothetical protein